MHEVDRAFLSFVQPDFDEHYLLRSGFDREDEWGFRALEPSRCCISSIALVLLKTGIIHNPNGERPVEVDPAQMATAQKLLLFWRKPAVSSRIPYPPFRV